MRFIATLIITLVCSSLAWPCDYAVRRVVYSSCYPVAIAPIIPAYVASYVPVQVAVPAYSAQYQPQVDMGQQLQTLINRIGQLESRLQGGGGYQGGGGQGSQQQPSRGQQLPAAGDNEKHAAIATLFNAKCASCHSVTQAATKGHNFQMFTDNGDLRALSALDVAKIAGKIYTGKMPKNGKLTDEEVAGIMEWVDSVANKDKEAGTAPPPPPVP